MIHVKYIERTPLNKEAYIKLVKKYAKTQLDIHICFDKRLTVSYGLYDFDSKRQRHRIQISLSQLKFHDVEGTIYSMICATLHELCHANQKEELGRSFGKKQYNCAEDIKSNNLSEFFSELEIDARTFENKNVLEAVEYYNSCCK